MSDVSQTAGRHVVILSHLKPDSFNHSIANAYCDAVRWVGQDVVLRDLYAIGFAPVLKAVEKPGPGHPHPSHDVADELELIRRCDVFVLIYPIWFGNAAAMLKRCVDRVFGAGVMPEAVKEGAPTSLLGNKQLAQLHDISNERCLASGGGPRVISYHCFQQVFGARVRDEGREARLLRLFTDELTPRFAGQYLQDVKDEAQRMYTKLAKHRDVDVRDVVHNNAPQCRQRGPDSTRSSQWTRLGRATALVAGPAVQ